jgi:chemotaxis protein CheX
MDEQFIIRIADAVDEAFEQFVGTRVTRLEAMQPNQQGLAWLSSVAVGEGVLKISMSFSQALATTVTATMFALPSAGVARDDIEDALGELCNVVTGQVKTIAVTEGPLGLPEVVQCSGNDRYVDEDRLVCELPFAVCGEPLVLTIERDARSVVAA